MVALYNVLRLLPLPIASGLSGWLGRAIGPHLKRNARAVNNLRLIFPEMSEAERGAVIREMWDNLFRVVGEYPHLSDYAYGKARHRIEVIGADIVDRAIKSGRPIIFFAAHLANWEMSPIAATQYGIPLHLVYRPPNHPVAKGLIERIRISSGSALLPKGGRGARELIQEIKRNGRIGILVDQKFNEGISVPFLGHKAMTSSAVAELTLKYDAVTIPAQVERVNGCDFRVTVHEPLDFKQTGNRPQDIRAGTEWINEIVSGWIRKRPGQWLWLHRRWPESV